MATELAQEIVGSSGLTATLGNSINSAIALFSTQDFYIFAISILVLWALRVVLLKSLVLLSRSEFAEKYRITKKPPITVAQNEREGIWIFGYFYDVVALVIIYYFGVFQNMPVFTWQPILMMFVIHISIVEFIYYWAHRALHWPWIYKNYHQYHHKSINTEPTTAVSFEFGERILYTALFAIAPITSYLLGYQSLITLVAYTLWFDLMNETGHINAEFFPWLQSHKVLRYFWYTPTFHAGHHTKFKKNYSLFMPWTDILFGTAVYPEEEGLPVTMRVSEDANKTPDFVLLVHGSYLASALYVKNLHPMKFGSFITKYCSNKYAHKMWMYITYPYLLCFCVYWAVLNAAGWFTEETFPLKPTSESKSPAIPADQPKSSITGTTRVLMNFGANYLIPSFYNIINQRIENCILDAQQQKIKVVVLGNFNKAEWLNHGGSDIVEKLGDKLNGTYISHGDTLSAATIYQHAMWLKEKGYWSKRVYITGATSKIGRGVVLSLVRHGITVRMLTQCKARFDEIAAEVADPMQRACLQYSHSLKEGADCDLWMTGKMIPHGRELLDAIPENAIVLNYAVPDPLTPALLATRPDLLHLDSGLLAYDKKVMAPRFTWLLPDGMIYACLAGGIVHAILGIQAHEVGAVEIDQMDVYWQAALRHGFKIPSPTSFYTPISLPPPRHMYTSASTLDV